MTKWRVAYLSRAVLALGLLVSTGCQRTSHRVFDVLQPCRIDEGPPDTYCGHLTVFEDRAAKTGRTIDLKIVVAPALRRDAKPDPLFIFEGGPGGGAATLAPYRVPMFRRFQLDRDIVLVDQRGTGASNPLDCSADVEAQDEDVRATETFPIERYRTCMQTLDADLRLYTTAIAMDDIDDVRRHLGYETINLWGGSYGTRAALVYLKQHESAVRTVVLDGVAPPDMQIPLYVARDSQRALDRLLADCAADAACAREFPDLGTTIDALWKRLEDRPRVAFAHPRTGKAETITVSARLVGAVVFQSLYAPEVAALLPQVLTDASKGRFDGLLALALNRETIKGAMSDGMFLSVVCAEDVARIRPEDIDRETAGRFVGTTMFDTQVKPCEFWPRATIADEYYEPATSSRPTLIFSGEIDPITPPSWGEHVARSLSQSRHFVVPGAGHGASNRGCAPELVAQFLDAGSAAALDGTCLTTLSRPPFFSGYTGPQRP